MSEPCGYLEETRQMVQRIYNGSTHIIKQSWHWEMSQHKETWISFILSSYGLTEGGMSWLQLIKLKGGYLCQVEKKNLEDMNWKFIMYSTTLDHWTRKHPGDLQMVYKLREYISSQIPC